VTILFAPQENRSNRALQGTVAVIFAFVLALLLMCSLVPQDGASGLGGSGTGTMELQAGAVPSEYVPWVEEAGSECGEITPPVIAAQVQAESDWDPDAVSPAGAVGIAQFLPSTFITWGRNDDGTGDVTPDNPRDEIMAQGRYDCYLASLMTSLEAKGKVTGSILSLTLAAYNAGPANVEAAGGPPSYTASYYQEIESLAASKYAQPAVSEPGGAAGSGSPAGESAVKAAEADLGAPYQYGGSCTDPHGTDPSGWCDCASLVQTAWEAAGVTIPRTTYVQWKAGTPVASVSQLVPGDLIFIPGSDATAAGPGHVGMYVGNGMLIDAPQTGSVVQFATVSSWETQIVAMRHIG
jgi:cell wall-associated NlpC family hydrolase